MECVWSGYENAAVVFALLAGIGAMLGVPIAMMIMAMGWADRQTDR